jgi:N-methylhydantoinase A
VPVPEGPLDAVAVSETFHDAHRALYGYDFRSDPSQQVEWVNLRVTGIGPITRPELRPTSGGSPDARTGTRPVCFDPADGYLPTEIHWRPHLSPGAVVTGPAVIEEYGSTVPIHPGFAARADKYGNLIVSAVEGVG